MSSIKDSFKKSEVYCEYRFPCEDYYSSRCGLEFSTDEEYMQPGHQDLIYCTKCGKKIKVIIEVKDDDDE